MNQREIQELLEKIYDQDSDRHSIPISDLDPDDDRRIDAETLTPEQFEERYKDEIQELKIQQEFILQDMYAIIQAKQNNDAELFQRLYDKFEADMVAEERYELVLDFDNVLSDLFPESL